MKYLGLDLSSVSSGYSVFDGCRLVESGSIVPAAANVMHRILEIVDRLEKIVRHHEPNEVIIEDVFYGSNYLTTKILNRLAGAVVHMLHSNSVDKITFVMPTAARRCLGILPKSTKAHIVKAVNAKFGLTLKLSEDDEADAIVIGHYGFWLGSNPNVNFDRTANDFFKSGVKTPRIKRRKK